MIKEHITIVELATNFSRVRVVGVFVMLCDDFRFFFVFLKDGWVVSVWRRGDRDLMLLYLVVLPTVLTFLILVSARYRR